MTRRRNSLRILRSLAAPLILVAATAAASSPSVKPGTADTGQSTIVREFYRARSDQLLWLRAPSGEAAEELLRLLGSAELDGLAKDKFRVADLSTAVQQAASEDSAGLLRADMMLSEAFVNYARELQRDPKVGVIYVDSQLKPAPSPPDALLRQAAHAPSLAAYVRGLGWMNPFYGQLRQALVAGSGLTEAERNRLSRNLERARALPPASSRYVIVNAADQRLYMYEQGKLVDQMKVVVGKPTAQTPFINAYIRFAVLNPYWNVPSDLAVKLAANFLKRGNAALQQKRYEIVSQDAAGDEAIQMRSIDWKAVASGRSVIQLRQLPGADNSMGRVKFMFPNSQGVWLHDTPARALFANDVRTASNGCIRLEDAWRLGSWLMGRPLKPTTLEPEKRIDLPEPVPVYITYLTAMPRGETIQYVADIYSRDTPKFIASPVSALAAQQQSSPGH